MTDIKDGGPAYPLNDGFKANRGMSVRQFYKAAALQGLLADKYRYGILREYVLAAAQYADAMLAEDKEHEEGQ